MTARAHSRTAPALAALDCISSARAARRPLRIRGAGSWLGAGRPVSAHSELSLEGARGIVEYVPGDLTITVGAATTLGDIAEATSRERQWLALDPAGDDSGTIGATVATGSSGSLAHAFGTPRDQVLGVEFVTGAGTVVRGGGRVVKNVAGFDLTRLVVGSWGTLGVITEMSLRLRALPEVDTTVAVALPRDVAAVASMLTRLTDARLAAYALEIVNEPLASRMGLGSTALLLARLAGNSALVSAQQATLASFGDARPHVDASAWRQIRGCDTGCGVVLRLSQRRSMLADTWNRAIAIAKHAGGYVHGTVSRGIVRVCLPGEPFALAQILRAELDRFPGTVIFEQLPSPLWTELARPTALDPLSRGVKRAFDPDAILNRGILGEPAS